MTNVQRMIINYINKNFVEGSVQIELKGLQEVRITDRNNEHMTLTVNMYCDIFDVERNKKIAVSNISHNLDDIVRNPYNLPTEWMNLPQ